MPQFANTYNEQHYAQSQRIQALAAAIQALTPHVEKNFESVASLALKDAIRQMKVQLLSD